MFGSFSEALGSGWQRALNFFKADGSLYVRRNLKNADQLHAWAKDAGIPNLVPPEEMHVTQVYSRAPVILAPLTNEVTAHGGDRHIAPLGDQGAVVMHFKSDELQRRWDESRAAGASWDYAGYKPHVSLSYDAGGKDVSTIKAPDFPLQFGPEIHEPLNENWAEDKGFRTAKGFRAALDRFNPVSFFKDQPSVGAVHVASASSEADGKKPKRKPKMFTDVMAKFDLAAEE